MVIDRHELGCLRHEVYVVSTKHCNHSFNGYSHSEVDPLGLA